MAPWVRVLAAQAQGPQFKFPATTQKSAMTAHACNSRIWRGGDRQVPGAGYPDHTDEVHVREKE